MKIVIALPRYITQPSGGYHVHYSYANLLRSRGHDVTVVFPRYADGPNNLKAAIRTPLWGLNMRLRNRPLTPAFPLDPKVEVLFAANLSGKALPDADVLIATAWTTAEILVKAPPRCGRKVYVAFDYEYLMTDGPATRERIEATYRMGFQIVAGSTVVAEVVRAAGGKVTAVVPCGIDFQSFGMDVAPQERDALTIGFPLRIESFKGRNDAIEASELLRARYGGRLHVAAFGVDRLNLPEWITWLQYPSQSDLRGFYNSRAVFLLPSHFEGWGLPSVEAMACGAALVTCDNGGSRDYAFDGENCLVVPPKRPDLLAAAIARLLDDPDLRFRLARAGHESVQRFTWQAAADSLEAVLNQS